MKLKIYEFIAEEMVQELYKADYGADYQDNGFAFDRALQNLGLKAFCDKWNEKHWKDYGEVERIVIKRHLARQELENDAHRNS